VVIEDVAANHALLGKQGGALKETIVASFAGWGSIAINSSSDINFASMGEDFAEAAGRKAEEMHHEMVSIFDSLPEEIFSEN
jgi:orotidine-5'-phosphate decarboxylase